VNGEILVSVVESNRKEGESGFLMIKRAFEILLTKTYVEFSGIQQASREECGYTQ
jgi:hypothetical protein